MPVSAQSDKLPVIKLTNPLGSVTDPAAIGGNAIQAILGILGSITLLVFVVGGVMWLTSGGNQERVQKGTRTMLYAAIGIFVIFSAYAILSVLIGGITG